MTEHVAQLKSDFPGMLRKEVKLRGDELFKADSNSNRSCKEKSEIFHLFAIETIFLCKRGCPEVEVGVNFLAAQAEKSTEQDCNKLVRLLSFSVAAIGDVLHMEISDSCILA